MDGQVGIPLEAGAEVHVRRSELTACMVRDPEVAFYDVLRQKLGWGEG